MHLKVRRLEPSDDRTTFRSGNIELDLFFLRYAGQNQFRHHVGTTYVAVDEGDTIYGFATVTASELSTTRLPAAKRKRLPQYPLPASSMKETGLVGCATGPADLSTRYKGAVAGKSRPGDEDA